MSQMTGVLVSYNGHILCTKYILYSSNPCHYGANVIRIHYYYYYYYYYVGRSAPGFLVISVLHRVTIGLMKVGSRITNGRQGVSCKVDKPWLVHGSECVFSCGVV